MLAFTVEASSFKVETSIDKLEINEQLSGVFSSLTKSQLPELQEGTITAEGSTKFNQYIRFTDTISPKVAFEKNDDNIISDYLFVQRNTGANNAFFEYELEFEQGLQSSISSGTLTDLEGKQLYIFNEPYTVTLATSTGNEVELHLVSGLASTLIEKEETKQITVNGKTYTLKITSVETTTKKTRLNVDGVDLPDLLKGEVYQLPDKTYIGITKVLTSTDAGTKDIVEVFIGARIIKFKDSNYQDSNFEEKVEINTVKIKGGYVRITASMIDNSLKISKIKYRLVSFDDIYVKKGEKISQYMGEQKAGLLGNMDMRYEGLTSTATNSISFTPGSNDQEYEIAFKNREGNTFSNIPFISNNGALKMGSTSNDLVIQENVLIDQNDYFVITDRNDKTGTSYILKYNSIDTSAQNVKIYDYATSTEKSITYANSTIAGILGTGELTIGSLKANMTINGSSGNPLQVDLDLDGSFENNVVNIVTADGGILVLEALSGSTYTVNLRTEATQFEENATNENIQFVFETRSGDAVGIQSTFSGITTQTKEGNTLGLSNYGVSMTYADPSGTDAETLTFLYPQTQKFAQVYIDVLASAALQTPESNSTVFSLCANGIQDVGETGVDCGGTCVACQSASSLPSCSDGLQNQGETGTDCGGPCQACIPLKQEGPCPTGCLVYGSDGLETCMDLGENTETIYCGKDLQIKLKKSNGLVCEEAYECKIGICEKGECGKNITIPALLLNIIALLAFFGSLIYMIKTLLTKV
jgi:hypothetical protein